MIVRRTAFSTEFMPTVIPLPRWIFGLALMLICAITSLLLVLQHFGMLSLPGCGAASGCETFLTSQYGNVFGWPTSFVGLAYFCGLAAAWTMVLNAGVSLVFRMMVLLGAVASSYYLLIMVLEHYVCWYCLVIHVSNLVYTLIVLFSRGARGLAPASIVAACAGFALVSALLNVVVSEQQRSATERAVKKLFVSDSPVDRQMPEDIASATGASIEAESPAEVESAGEATPNQVKAADAIQEVPQARLPYQRGAPEAKMQLVVFYDYESALCPQIEEEVQQLIAEYGETLSVTARHFPMCADCNFSVSSTTNPNACRAALAAETAGQLKGNAGFWEMHEWLLQQNGRFTDGELKECLVKMGYSDPTQFIETMQLPQVMAGIVADIVDAQAKQISGAPAVLLNGNKLSGTLVGDRLVRKVASVVESRASLGLGPASGTTAIDQTITEIFPPEMQLSAMASTVRIINTQGGTAGSGTIFAESDGFVYVLTAFHLVKQNKRVEVQTYSTDSYPDPAEEYPWATVIATSDAADLAVVRFSAKDAELVPLRMVPVNLVPLKGNFPVLTVGCDGLESPPTCLANEVVAAKRVRRMIGSASVMVWEVAQESASGRSGGPLVDKYGLLLGIASGVSDGKGYFCHAEEIARFLEQHGLQALAKN